MPNIKQIALVSASPKTKQERSVSDFLVQRGDSLLKSDAVQTHIVNVRHAMARKEAQRIAFQTLEQADAIVLIFPLYFFCMPGMLTCFLQDFAVEYPKSQRNTSVYAIVNCGFPEPEINREAMRVVEQFAIQTGRTFLGGVMIGCGGMLLGAQNAPFMKPLFGTIDRLFDRIRNDASSEESQTACIDAATVKFPRQLYFIGGNAGWRSMARKNHLKKKDLFRKPYQA